MPRLDPTPEQRADMVIKKLEKVIKDSKESSAANKGGMSYRKWQNEARKEIISAILNAERCQSYKSNFFNRFLMLVGATTASLGFLGAIVAYGQTGRSLVAAVCVALGIIFIVMGFEWLTINNVKLYFSQRRDRKLARINDLDRQIKVLEQYLEDRLDDVKKESGYRGR